MEISSLHKYIHLNKFANGTTEVLFAGQPCLFATESAWTINPVFAKLVYGANIFQDIPVCSESYTSMEEAVAGGLVRLHELGAFNTEVDLPEDTYAATMTQVQEEVKQFSIDSTKNVMEASLLFGKIMSSITEGKFDKFNKYTPVNESQPQKRDFVVHYETEDGKKKKMKHSSYSPRGIIKNWPDDLGSRLGGRHKLIDVTHNGKSVMNESVDDDHEQWRADVQKAHPGVKMKFKGRIEDGKDNISAEDEKGRTHGVWDNDKNKGHIFKLEEDVLDEGKFVPTHLASGKPNPNHPAFETHQAAYKKQSALDKPVKEKPLKPHELVGLRHYHSAYDAIPDLDPHDVVANVAKKLKVPHETVAKAFDHYAKDDGHKSFHDAYHSMVTDYYRDNTMESVLSESESWYSKAGFDTAMEKKHGVPVSTKVDKDGRTHYYNKEGLSTGFKDPYGGEGTYYVIHSKPVKFLSEKHLTSAELEKREEIVKALKKDPKFQSKRGKSSAFAIATAKAKEVA